MLTECPWMFYPAAKRPPAWVPSFVEAFERVLPQIDSTRVGANSDDVLAAVRPGLESIGYIVEASKAARDRLDRPVLFKEQGQAEVTYEPDAFLPDEGVVVEVEAGRAASNNAVYRDLIRASLMVDVAYLAAVVPVEYWNNERTKRYAQVYDKELSNLRAIFSSGRLQLPLEGVLLLGY